MKKIVLMMSAISASICLGGELVLARKAIPQQAFLLVMAAGIAGENNSATHNQITMTFAKPKQKIVPKNQMRPSSRNRVVKKGHY